MAKAFEFPLELGDGRRIDGEAELGTPTSPTDGSASTAAMIIVHAASLFRRNGYSKTTTRDLGRAVGIRGPSVYHHYKTKEEILFGICRESLHRLRDRVVTDSSSAAEPIERLRTMIDTHVRNLLEDRDMHTTTFMEMRWLSDDLRDSIATQRDEYEALFRATVEAAQAARSLRTDIGASELTLALLGLMNWTVFWYRPDGALTPDELASILVTVFLDGVASAADNGW